MRTHKRMLVATILGGTVAGFAGPSWAGIDLKISPFGYQVTQIQPVPGNSHAIDVTARAGICGDAATGVSARLSSSSTSFVILDGDVRFGNVARASCLRPISSQDTFTLRVLFPSTPSELLKFLLDRFQALSWIITCGGCGSNQPPVADAGPDQTAYVGQRVALDGTGSTDAEGSSLTYAWSFVSRPAGSAAALEGVSTARPSFAPDRRGEYIVQLQVSDGQLTSAPDTVRIDTRNSPPVANAGPDRTALVGETVLLDGTGSTDVDGDPLYYSWSLASRPPASGAEIGSPASSVASFTPDVPGQYVIELIVHDGSTASAPDVVLVSTANSRPVADAGPDQTAFVGQVVLLDGSASHDVDGDPLTFRWSLVTRPPGSSAGLDDPARVGPALTIDRPGIYVAQLVVNDGTSDSDPDTVVVSTINSRPVADAGVAQRLPWNLEVALDGSGSSDADGDALTFEWALLDRPVGSGAVLADAGTPHPSFRADRPGVYVAQLVVSDGALASAPATVTITATNEPPLASDDFAQTMAGTPVEIDVLANDHDPDGDPLELVSVSPPGNGDTALAGDRVRYTPAEGFDGTDSFLYSVSDGADSSTARVTVLVSRNLPPVAVDDEAYGFLDSPVTIAVLANDFDPDGDALSIVEVTQPDAGSVSIDATVLVYSPPPGFTGSTRFAYVVSDGRGGSAAATVTVTVYPPRPGPPARLELEPKAVLLTAPNELRYLTVRAYDAAGARIPFVGYETLEFWSSNEEEIPVDGGGRVEALVVPGSALVRVRLRSDPAVVSAPVAVSAVELTAREPVELVSDQEILDEPVFLDVAERRYQVTLNRFVPEGALVLGSGESAVMGRVVAVEPDPDLAAFRTEIVLVPLTTIFENLTVSYSFAPEDLATLVEADAPLRAAARTEEPASRVLTAADAAPGGSSACDLEFVSTELAAALTGGATPHLRFDVDLAISEGSLERFVMVTSGSLDVSLKLTANVGAAVNVEGSCTKKLVSLLVPIGGPLSLVLGARIPIGVTGSLGLEVQQNLATVEVEQDFRAITVLGVSYQRGLGFLPVSLLDVEASPLRTVVDLPPSALRFRGKAFLGGTAGIHLGVLGETLFELADLRGGPELQARFGEPYDVSTDTAFESGYELKLVGQAGPGGDVKKAFEEIFGTSTLPFDTSVHLETTLGTSPKRGVVMKADRAEFAAGDTVTFRVDLDGTAWFPFVGYNVSEIRIYLRDEASSTARLVASTPSTEGQTSFELTWIADRDGRATNATSGNDNFFAFVVPNLLSAPSSSYPLELGAVRGAVPIEILPREVILPTGGTRQFTARIDGEDTTAVRWTATGGTISSSGFFRAGATPGTYKVTVARLDAPTVFDEAFVEVRPQCVPGTAAYCGFSYAPQFWPSNRTWYTGAVNDNGDWVGLLYDTPNPRDASNPPLIYSGRGNVFQLVTGLNLPSIRPYFRRTFDIGRPYIKLTNSNAFAGCYSRPGTYSGGGFVSQNGVTRLLDPLPGHDSACAWDVSEDLVAVGESFSFGGNRAVRWVDGVAEDLGYEGVAVAISADGRILILKYHGGEFLGVVVLHDGTATELTGSDCVGWDINSSGDVVGQCVDGNGYVWRNGEAEPLAGTGIPFAIIPYAINDRGDVLGRDYQQPADVLWRDGARNVLTFPYVDGPPAQEIVSISRTKSLLGGSGLSCTGNDCRTYIWTAYPIELVFPPN